MTRTIELYDSSSDSLVSVDMSPDQEAAVDAILEGEHLVYRLCGGAGVGKSAVVSVLKEELEATVAATTARAALHVGGCTVDSLFAFKRDTWKTSAGRLKGNMKACGDWIIIDEASMIGTKMADCIWEAVSEYNKKLILVGDWAQAPPVKDTWPINHPLMESGVSCKLTTNHRQGQGDYLDCLQEIRSGHISERSRTLFRQRVVSGCPQDDQYTYMYGTNRAAEKHNQARFKILLEQTRCPPVEPEAMYIPEDPDCPGHMDQIEKILAGSRLSHKVKYCVGAKVMLTINNYERHFVNGDIGYVLAYFSSHEPDPLPEDLNKALYNEVPAREVFMQKFDEPIGKNITGLLVRLDRNGREIIVPRMTETVCKPNGEPFYSVDGLPVRLAYAITVHKGQGCTLDKAYFAMNSLWPEHGLAYVGLSRTRSIEGLLLEAWRPDLVKCDKSILKYL